MTNQQSNCNTSKVGHTYTSKEELYKDFFKFNDNSIKKMDLKFKVK